MSLAAPVKPGTVLGLAMANAVALLAAAAASLGYARWLDSTAFAHWATAMAVARALLLVLDGGLKTALVRRVHSPDAATLRQLGRLGGAVALGLAAAVAAVAAALWHGGVLPNGDAVLLAAYAGAYLLSYPALLPALARLERAHCFAAIGRAEGASVLVEFALPAAGMAAGLPWWLAFALAVGLARLLRSGWILRAARALPPPPATASAAEGQANGTRSLLREGLGVQAVAALSMVRDQMHLWLLAPMAGAHWAGSYTFALTAGALLSQAAVQTASRVALPVLRVAAPDQRWPQVLAQTRTLAICTLPPLALLPAWLAHGNQAWWEGRWTDAVALAPWLALRMLPSVATTTLGAWLMVARTPAVSARAHAGWAGVEAAAAALALLAGGPLALAASAAATPWLGLVLFVAAAQPEAPLAARVRALATVLLARPSLGLALAGAALLAWQPGLLLPVTLALPLAWASEPQARQALRRALGSRVRPAWREVT